MIGNIFKQKIEKQFLRALQFSKILKCLSSISSASVNCEVSSIVGEIKMETSFYNQPVFRFCLNILSQ